MVAGWGEGDLGLEVGDGSGWGMREVEGGCGSGEREMVVAGLVLTIVASPFPVSSQL